MKTDISTKKKIENQAKINFALYGNEGVRIRTLSSNLDIAKSSIYHHFSSKEEMLDVVFEDTRKELGVKRSKLPESKTVVEMLEQRVDFQFENATDVIFVLKYYTQYRNKFEKNPTGYVPQLAYRHIEEVLEQGVNEGLFMDEDIEMQAKVITHAINGFILEYYPEIPSKSGRAQLVKEISEFIYRGIKKKGGE